MDLKLKCRIKFAACVHKTGIKPSCFLQKKVWCCIQSNFTFMCIWTSKYCKTVFLVVKLPFVQNFYFTFHQNYKTKPFNKNWFVDHQYVLSSPLLHFINHQRCLISMKKYRSDNTVNNFISIVNKTRSIFLPQYHDKISFSPVTCLIYHDWGKNVTENIRIESAQGRKSAKSALWKFFNISSLFLSLVVDVNTAQKVLLTVWNTKWGLMTGCLSRQQKKRRLVWNDSIAVICTFSQLLLTRTYILVLLDFIWVSFSFHLSRVLTWTEIFVQKTVWTCFQFWTGGVLHILRAICSKLK